MAERLYKVVKQSTLCWDCINAVPEKERGCSWSRSFTPVPGWVAKESAIYSKTYESETVSIKSYCVMECPEFKEG